MYGYIRKLHTSAFHKVKSHFQLQYHLPCLQQKMAEHPRNGDKNNPLKDDLSWKKVQSKKAPAATARAYKMAENVSKDNEGEGGTLQQVRIINLRFMFQTRKESKVFNLARGLKELISAGKAFNKDFSIMPLFGDGSALFKPQYIPNSQELHISGNH
jgi:hypothetical protein